MVVETGKIREVALAVEQMTERADLAKEDVKAAIAAGTAAGIDAKALKLCLGIRKAKPAKAKAFLDSFDACRDALGLDDQLDLEDAIAAADVDDEDITEHAHAVARKSRGRARELN